MNLDILGVSDQEVWRYGEQLRRLAKQNGCHNIRFARICDLISGTDTEHHQSQKLTEALYLTKASEYRGLLVAMTPPDFNVLEAIANDPDIAKTYKGYKKFLMSERDDRPNRSRSQTERENSAIAKSMILRGKVSFFLPKFSSKTQNLSSLSLCSCDIIIRHLQQLRQY